MPRSLPLRFEVPFGSYLVYSPRGTSEMSKSSRNYRNAAKYDTPGFLLAAAAAIKRNTPECLNSFFTSDVTFVPVPRSAPIQADSLWPSRRICEDLIAAGLGGHICPGLVRVRAIQKSAFAGAGERPDPSGHFSTIAWPSEYLPTQNVVLVDDFVTKGSSIAGCYGVVKEAFPDANVRAFALIRTMGLIPDVDKIVDPCAGVISYNNGHFFRRP